MKKTLLFLAAAALMASTAHATVTQVAPGENVISAAITAATAGDVLELSTGTYTEWNAITLDKAITLKAADGATPVVKFNVFRSNGASFELNGLNIENLSSSDYFLRTGANVEGTIALKNCTLENPAPTPYLYLSSNSVESIVIENCVFKGTTKNQGGLIYGGSNAVTNFTMTNSTAYNIAGELAVWLGAVTNATVDHCTFYNCGTRVLYLASAPTSCSVSNCIVVAPEVPEANHYCIATYGGTVENCLYYNLNAPRSSSATVTGCINADPLFVDAAAGDFSFALGSPLFKAATDGSNIGDPRWTAHLSTTPVVLPNTLDMGNAEGYSTPVYETEYMDFGPNGSSNDTALYAMWGVDVTPGVYNVTVDATSSNGYTLNLYLRDINTWQDVKTISGGWQVNDLGSWDLSDVPAGQYVLILKNSTAWSAVKVKSVTLTAEETPVDPTAVENTEAAASRKLLIDGQLYILKSGCLYSATGLRVE